MEGKGERVMTAEEVRDFLKIPLSTVYGLTKKGKLKGVKVGKHWRYLQADVEGHLLGSGVTVRSRPTSGPGFVERRRNPRVPCEIPAVVTVTLPRRQDTKEGVIHNISKSGTLLVLGECENWIRIGVPVHINFKLPTGPSAGLELEGRVVRGEVRGDIQLGVEFRNLLQTDLR